MKKIASLVGVLMVLTAGAALAQPGINLAWNDCLGAGGGAIDKTQTCTNSGTIVNNIYTSFISPVPIANLGGTDGTIVVQINEAALDSWWGGGTVRFGGTAGASTCPGWYDAAPNGAVPFGPDIKQDGSGARLRVRMVVSVATGQEQPVDNSTEYHNHIINIKYGTGTFNNAGCLTAACLVENDLLLQAPGIPDTHLNGPSSTNFVTWRGGAVPGGCPAATPTTKATWGSIKALYR